GSCRAALLLTVTTSVGCVDSITSIAVMILVRLAMGRRSFGRLAKRTSPVSRFATNTDGAPTRGAGASGGSASDGSGPSEMGEVAGEEARATAPPTGLQASAPWASCRTGEHRESVAAVKAMADATSAHLAQCRVKSLAVPRAMADDPPRVIDRPGRACAFKVSGG